MENHQIIIAIVLTVFFGIITFFIKVYEDKKHIVNPFESKPKHLIALGVLIPIGLFFLSNIIGLIIFSIARIIFAFSISHSAKSMNRKAVLWGIMGFLSTEITLVILGLSDFLIDKENEEEANQLIIEFNESESSLNNLNNSNLITEEEYYKKKNSLLDNYQDRLSRLGKEKLNINFQEEIKAVSNEEKIEQLLEAFQKGIISKEEYEEKREHLS